MNVADSSHVSLGQAPKRLGEKWRGGETDNQTNQYRRRTDGARTRRLGKGVEGRPPLIMGHHGTHIEEEGGATEFESAYRHQRCGGSNRKEAEQRTNQHMSVTICNKLLSNARLLMSASSSVSDPHPPSCRHCTGGGPLAPKGAKENQKGALREEGKRAGPDNRPHLSREAKFLCCTIYGWMTTSSRRQ
jgi:hypothetical protein